jgi:hypothetical protein
MDEATSDNHHRVLGVLASYFSPEEGKVVVQHLTAFDLNQVTAESIFTALDDFFLHKVTAW